VRQTLHNILSLNNSTSRTSQSH